MHASPALLRLGVWSDGFEFMSRTPGYVNIHDTLLSQAQDGRNALCRKIFRIAWHPL